MIGQEGEHSGPIDTDGQVTLYWDADQPINLTTLHAVLDQAKTKAWSGVLVGPNESFDGVWLRLTATEPRIAAEPTAVESGRCTPAIASRSPAIVQENSLAYFTLRRLDDDGDKRRWELGAIGHGPHGEQLAETMCETIQLWDHDRSADPVITAYLHDTPDDQLPDTPTITKPAIRMIESY